MIQIIQREYNKWRIYNKQPLQSVRWITLDEAKQIYKANYWDAVGCDNLPAGLDLAAFDASVNNGTGRAEQWLLQCDHDIDKFCDLRLGFDQRLGRLWYVFGRGWATRIEGIRHQAKVIASGGHLWTVSEIQRELNKLGANLVIDGVNGPATKAAIKAFQASHQLEQDGIFGPDTQAALEKALV